jgi:hypothetical protein
LNNEPQKTVLNATKVASPRYRNRIFYQWEIYQNSLCANEKQSRSPALHLEILDKVLIFLNKIDAKLTIEVHTLDTADA